MPTPDETKKFFSDLFDRTAATYDAVDADFFSTFGAGLVDHARLSVGDQVLDVGAGRGAVLRPAAQAVGPSGQVVGIDLSPQMVAATAAELQANGPRNASIQQGDAEHPPQLDGGWDAITAGLLVFFLPDAPGALRRWRTSLKTDGALALSTFADDDPLWHPVFAAMKPHLPEAIAPSQLPLTGWHRTDDGVVDTLASAGFRSITSATHMHVTHFRDAEHWIAFSYSNGMRAYWESTSDEARPAMLTDVMAALDALTEPDGSLHMSTGIRYTRATA
jgi:ubiquinone/menaquinone biosynthesis C-methylase UbiE